MRSASLRIGLLALAVLGAGCAAKVQAVAPEAPMPTLDAPPAPPRVIAVYEEPVEPPKDVPAETPAAPSRPPVRPARPEPAPEPPPAAARPTPPSPPLTLAPTPGAEAATEASIRSLLTRAARDLARVNVAALGVDGRTQFDTARRFLQQAEDALKSRNLVFAGKLADKAAVMAGVLVR